MSLPVAPDHTPASLRSDISCTLFLNDPDEYEGGEPIIADTYGEHEIKLPAGDLIIYPSTSLHRVAPVTRGMRIASFFWVQSLVRQATHRHQLLQLDTAYIHSPPPTLHHNTILRLHQHLSQPTAGMVGNLNRFNANHILLHRRRRNQASTTPQPLAAHIAPMALDQLGNLPGRHPPFRNHRIDPEPRHTH